ncbi:MAG: GYD domain-containing protein [Fuerstiella sp.]
MATYVSLVSFTERGQHSIKNTVERASAFCEAAGQHGASVRDVYWTMGKHDGVLVFEAPDDETATALMLALSAQGNVRTETLRAFDAEQMKTIVGHLA